MRPQRTENPDTFNGSDVPQDSTGVVVSTPPSSPTAAPSSSSSSSAESKDEGKDESATSDIFSGISNSSSGGNNQNEDVSNRAAIDPPASDGHKGLEEDQVAMEIDTAPPLGGDSAPLLPIPATAPAAPSSSSSSSATSMDIQEDKKVSKDDRWKESGKDKEDVMEVDEEVDVEMEMETEGEGEVEVEVKEAEKKVVTDPNALEDPTFGVELKSEITEVTSKDSADPVSTTDEGVATASDTTGVEDSHLIVAESTEEGMVVDLLPVKSEIKEESAASSSSSTSATSTTTIAPTPTPTTNVESTIVKSEKVAAVISTDVSSKATVTEPAAVVVPPIMPETLPRAPDTFSAIHSLRGYLDVGSSSLFAPSEPWVLATASLLMKRKLSKS